MGGGAWLFWFLVSRASGRLRTKVLGSLLLKKSSPGSVYQHQIFLAAACCWVFFFECFAFCDSTVAHIFARCSDRGGIYLVSGCRVCGSDGSVGSLSVLSQPVLVCESVNGCGPVCDEYLPVSGRCCGVCDWCVINRGLCRVRCGWLVRDPIT